MTTVDCTSYDTVDHVFDDAAVGLQLVSDPLQAQTILNMGLSMQARYSEAHANNNLFPAIQIYLIDSSGSAVGGGTVLTTTLGSNEISSTALTNCDINTTISLGPLTVLEGYRLVLEIGVSGDPANTSGVQGHNFSLSVGDDSGTDLPLDTSTTSAFNPWVEFAQDLQFMAVHAFSGNLAVSTA